MQEYSPPTTLDSSCEVLGLRALDASGPSLADAAARDALLQEVRAGRLVRLELDAVVFAQTPEPNRKFVRFAPDMLERFAKSFEGAPFLRDHDQQDLAARGGTVLSSQLIPDHRLRRYARQTVPAIRQTIQLVKPWAVEAALDGTLDRFSIGWFPNADVLCTACGNPMFSLDCEHFPGDEFDGEGGSKRRVELLYTDAEGVETSGVAVPAVRGTGVDEIRTALAAARRPRKERPMHPKLTSLLSLAEGADENALAAAVEGITSERDQLKTLLAAERDAHETLKASLEALQGEIAKREADELAAKTDALVERAKAEGRIRPKRDAKGAELASEIEKTIRRLAAGPGGLPVAAEFVDGLAQVIPIGLAAAQTPRLPPEERLGGEGLEQFPAEQRALLRSMGITDDIFKQYGPKPGELARSEDKPKLAASANGREER